MPELPEVERVRQSLARQVVGRKVRAVQVYRAEVVRGSRAAGDLLAGGAVIAIERLGKQLALVGEDGRCVCIHLGMTGALRWHDRNGNARRGPPDARGDLDPHTHLIWRFADRSALHFRDPRRFGGLWTFASLEALHADRWSVLGEDALRVTPARLHRRLQATSRPIKAALLDQHVIAGLGNIYVDELLFAMGVNPARPADTLDVALTAALVRRMRTLLRRAIAAGGSSIRDYADGTGLKGSFQDRHRVYGRGGQPCRRCRQPLAISLIAGRTTVFCTFCQSA